VSDTVVSILNDGKHCAMEEASKTAAL